MPFVGAAVSAVGSAFAAGGILASGGALSLLGKLLVSTAISLVTRALTDDPVAPGIRNVRTQTGGVNPASFILGRYATAGTAVCPEMSYGVLGGFGIQAEVPNEFLVYVIDVGDIPGGIGLEDVIIDGVSITLGLAPEYLPGIPIYEMQTDPVTGLEYSVKVGERPGSSKGLPGTGAYAGQIWVKFRDGTDTEADPYLREVFWKYPERPWTADMIGRGMPLVIVTLRRNPALFATWPECRFVVGGIPLYDWRRDSTAGGVGAQRWANPATWQPSENPVVQIYNILRGIDFGEGFVWGGEAPASAFRVAEWSVEANKADIPVPLDGGGTEPAYRAGFEVTGFDEPAAIIAQLLRGCGGQIADVGGVWRIRIGAPALPVWAFGDDDVIVSSPQDYAPFPSLDATYNAITATFPDPELGWEPTEAPPRYNAGWEALDQGRRLPADLNLSATPYPNQVQRVMRAYIEGERRFANHMLTLPPEGGRLEPLDTVSWASQANGYAAKAFEMTEIAHDLIGGNAQVSLREVDPADHNWTPAFELPFNRPSMVVVPRPSAQVGGAVVSAVSLLDGGSTARRPAIRLAWSAPSKGVFRGLEWELRLAGQVEVRQGSTQAVTAGEVVIAEGILPATDYQLRARWVADQAVDWTPWLAVITADVRVGVADLDDALADAVTPDTTPPAVPTGLAASTSVLADGRGLLALTWTAPTDSDLSGYQVRVRIGTGNFVTPTVASARFEAAIIPGQTFSAQVLAFDTSGNRSAYTALVNGTALRDTAPPAVPAGLAVTPGYQLLWLKWAANTESDFHHYEIREQTAATPAPVLATTATFSSTGDQMARSGLPDNATRHYWIRGVDASGNKSAWSSRVQGLTAASAGINAAALEGLVNAASFATSIKPVEVLTALPPAPHVLGRQVFLTTDAKLYRNTGSGWTRAVDGLDLASNSVTTGAVAAGAINTAQLAAGAVTAAKMLVGDMTNLVPDGSLTDPEVWGVPTSGWTIVNPTTTLSSVESVGSIQWTSGVYLSGKSFAVYPGQEYYMSYQVARLSAGQYRVWANIEWLDRLGDVIAKDTLKPDPVIITTGGVFKPEGSFTAPVLAVSARWQWAVNGAGTTATVIAFWAPAVRAKASGELIVDGSIQARHITTGELITSTAQIAEAVITDANIANLNASKLDVGTVTADKMNSASLGVAGLSVFGGELKSNGFATGVSGWRIKNDGDVELNSLVVRQDMIAKGAVTTSRLIDSLSSTTITATTFSTAQKLGKDVEDLVLSPANDPTGPFFPLVGSLGDRPLQVTINATIRAAVAPAAVYFRVEGFVPLTGLWQPLGTDQQTKAVFFAGMQGVDISHTAVGFSGGNGADLNFYSKLRLKAYVESDAPFSARSVVVSNVVCMFRQVTR
jgi:hypothetical protein